MGPPRRIRVAPRFAPESAAPAKEPAGQTVSSAERQRGWSLVVGRADHPRELTVLPRLVDIGLPARRIISGGHPTLTGTQSTFSHAGDVRVAAFITITSPLLGCEWPRAPGFPEGDSARGRCRWLAVTQRGDMTTGGDQASEARSTTGRTWCPTTRPAYSHSQLAYCDVTPSRCASARSGVRPRRSRSISSATTCRGSVW